MCRDQENENTDTAEMHKMIKEIAGLKTFSSTGCIKSKEGAIVMEKDKVLQRWTEYIAEIFHDNRGAKPIIRKNMEEPEILKSGVRAAMAKMKRNKSAGPDEIVIELLTALEDFGIEKVTKVINGVSYTGVIPEDLSKLIFIALPKRAGANECELHKTISLKSHITKLTLRIIMSRARSRIRK